jgi:hypothetical protein
MGGDGVENKMATAVGSGNLPLKFRMAKQILSLNPMGWFAVMVVVDGSRSAGGGYPIQKNRPTLYRKQHP